MQPGPFVPPPVVSDQQVRPPLWWFGVAGGIALVGLAAGVALWVTGFLRVNDRVDDFTRVDVPGSRGVDIDDPGGYSVYHEYPGADDVGDSLRSEPAVTITDPSGDEVFLEPYDSSVTYDFSGHEGEALYSFDADEAGTYEVTTDGEPGSEIAVGPGLGQGLVASIVGGLAVGGAGVVGGAVIAIVTGVRRGRSRRALNVARWQQAQAGRGWPGAPGPGGPGGPGGWGPPPGAGWGPPPGAGWGPPPGPQGWSPPPGPSPGGWTPPQGPSGAPGPADAPSPGAGPDA